MLLYQGGWFSAAGITFSLIEGMALETSPDLEEKQGLVAWTPDQTICISWGIEDNSLDTYEQIAVLFESDDNSLHLEGEITPVEINGLRGHQAHYTCASGSRNYEAWLSAPGTGTLCFLVQSIGNGEEKILDNHYVIAAMDSIHISSSHSTDVDGDSHA